ncbi:hypothetical protein JOQ06_004880 [Pogonophryne albipinna]|uniref:Uncharacterized protein n=2 Tax=Notothenioidei TaxID=8205 RepID=A0AAD6APC1_9TELE|nr:hypothetical protein KUCAC02_019613 [Chaenocephalus aceratus]KAJ4929269.1 hypothetical protein JOQ06_004880 [Pogonophryne albipinna]
MPKEKRSLPTLAHSSIVGIIMLSSFPHEGLSYLVSESDANELLVQCDAGIVWRAHCVPAATDCGPSLLRSRALEAAIIWTPASLRHMGQLHIFDLVAAE